MMQEPISNEEDAEPLSLDINNNNPLDEIEGDDFLEQEKRVSNLNNDYDQLNVNGEEANVRGSLGMFNDEHQDFDDDDIAAIAGEGDGEEEGEGEGDDEKGDQQPLLFVDINLGGDEQERIVVFEGDTADELARSFCVEHNLDDETK